MCVGGIILFELFNNIRCYFQKDTCEPCGESRSAWVVFHRCQYSTSDSEWRSQSGTEKME